MGDPRVGRDGPETADPVERLRALRRVRQIRDFTGASVDPAHVDAIVDVGRWSGSSMNGQPWRFIIIRDRETITRIHELGVPETRCLRTATAAVAIALPVDQGSDIENAFDDGRAAERMLIAANLLDLGAAVAWVQPELRGAVARLLGIPPSHFLRTMLALGNPTAAARLPKSAPGEARLPRASTVYEERWPQG